MRIERPKAILALLTGLNFLNYVDRYLVAAVSPKFQEELGLSDFQTGLAISAFMVGYFLTSPIFGRLGDKGGQRRWLIALGVGLWSAATAFSGLATGALSLVIARVAVGVGEASYATLAPTIIDDLAPPGRKNQWLAIFYMATPVGSALGYLLGGFLEHAYGWRSAFFVAGGPGVFLALVVLLIREPERVIVEHKGEGSLKQLWGAPLYVACCAGLCAYTFALGGFAAWAPKFLYKVHHMELKDADFAFGVVAVVAGIVGTVLGGTVADRGLAGANDETRVRAYLRYSAITTLVAVPFAILTIAAPTATIFFVGIFCCEAALFASTSPINAVILGSVPATLRASAMAVSIFAIHAFGDFPSPPLIGLIADHATLRLGLAMLPVAILLGGILWLRGAKAPLTRAQS